MVAVIRRSFTENLPSASPSHGPARKKRRNVNPFDLFDVMNEPILITMGDAAGIGPDIVAKAFRDEPALMSGCVVAGDVAVMRRATQRTVAPGSCAMPVAVLGTLADAAQSPPGCVPVVQATELAEPPAFGKVDASAGWVVVVCLVWVVQAALRGEAAAIVTAPLHKEALAAAGGAFPGHTELLQAEAARSAGKPVAALPVRMMLANDELRTVLVSIHVSMREALDAVTQANVLETLRITHSALSRILGRSPRIGVAGLNPHAGEGGLFGSEEAQAIAPAIASAVREGIDARGPFAPDTIFMRARNTASHAGEFDVVVAMYHDQGLIPVKYLGVDKGVNVTLGLPFVRTSPDHGTAFDLAGTGRAWRLRRASALLQGVANFA